MRSVVFDWLRKKLWPSDSEREAQAKRDEELARVDRHLDGEFTPPKEAEKVSVFPPTVPEKAVSQTPVPDSPVEQVTAPVVHLEEVILPPANETPIPATLRPDDIRRLQQKLAEQGSYSVEGAGPAPAKDNKEPKR